MDQDKHGHFPHANGRYLVRQVRTALKSPAISPGQEVSI